MKKLTEKQKEVLDFIAKYQDDNGVQPTLKEMATKFGVIPPAISSRLDQLERKGFITKERKYNILKTK